MDRKKWAGPSQDSLKKAYNDRGKFPDAVAFKDIFTKEGAKLLWKGEDRSHKIRLLPSHPNDNILGYGLIIHQHEQVGANHDKYLCLKRMSNMNCPICEQQAELWESSPEMAKELYPKMRYLVWMIDLTLPADKQVPKIWSCPKTAMDDMLGISYKKSTDEILNLANIDQGIPIYFDRQKVKGAKFSQYKNFQLDDNASEVKDEWLDAILQFIDCIMFESYETIKNAFFGTNSETKQEVPTLREAIDVPPFDVEQSVVTNSDTAIDDMDREELESIAGIYLSVEFEIAEIADMGTKKLKRLVKEAMEKKLDNKESDEIEIEEETEPVDPIASLKNRLKERTGAK